MLLDFEHRDTPAPAHAQVCVVGAGAAGISLAVKLASAGRSVTLLEAGGRWLERNAQNAYASETTGHAYEGIHHGRFRVYGGTTTEWGGQMLELDRVDFESRPHVQGSGWPIRKEELQPCYEEAAVLAGLEGSHNNDDAGRDAVLRSLRLPPLSPGPAFTLPLSRWCPERNFAVRHRQVLEKSAKLGVYLHGNVVDIELNPARTRIAALWIRSQGGRSARVSADEFVLCLGGIETTRLLLQPPREGSVPWQANRILGRFYKDHIRCERIPIDRITPQPVQMYFGQMESAGFKYHLKLQLSAKAQQCHGVLNVAGSLQPFAAPDLSQEQAVRVLRHLRSRLQWPGTPDLLQTVRHLPGIAANWARHRRRMGAPAWRRTMLCVHCEQLPQSASMITLAGSKDALGMYRTRLHWQIAAEEIHTIRTYVREAERHFAQQGFARIQPPASFFDEDAVVLRLCRDSNHHMGATRMADSAQDGVVDRDLRLHGVANGWVCSASVFPSAGYSNPTHTVLALAMRLAQKLLTRPA